MRKILLNASAVKKLDRNIRGECGNNFRAQREITEERAFSGSLCRNTSAMIDEFPECALPSLRKPEHFPVNRTLHRIHNMIRRN